MKQKFKINGMSCGSCRQTVEKALQGVEGVTSVQVSMSPPEAIIEKADSVTIKQLNSALSKAGDYSIGEDEPTTSSKNKGGCCCG
ncbi:MAG: heavy-metal-associated domain-containing protein [Flavobacteriaceae bacterium]|nr:heavy-metal-associated domain-containing protein [Flavobacteriaceae bacterium]